MDKETTNRIKAKLAIIDKNLKEIKSLLGIKTSIIKKSGIEDLLAKAQAVAEEPVKTVEGEKIIQGVFNGQNMIDASGQEYPVPANYASKSKMVEGDALKLTIKPDGSFIYKQIGPVDRKRAVGLLAQNDEDGEYRVIIDDKAYRVLLASITYFKGEPGDQVTALLPISGQAAWVAVDNIIKAGLLPETDADGANPSPEKKVNNPIDLEVKDETQTDNQSSKEKPFFYGGEIEEI